MQRPGSGSEGAQGPEVREEERGAGWTCRCSCLEPCPESNGESWKGLSRSHTYILKVANCSEENGLRGAKEGVERPWEMPRFIRRAVGEVMGVAVG